MPVKFYMDVHIPGPVTEQLRIRGVDVLAATEAQTNTLPDDELLEVATAQRRLLVTSDILFRVMAENWQVEGREFWGLAFAPAKTSIGRLVEDLELIAKASEQDDWRNSVVRLPFK